VAAYTELNIEQYATFSTTVNVLDSQGDAVNLYGYTAASQIRKSYYSTTANSFTAAVTGIANGEITLSMTAANTANLSSGRYLYDLVITSPESVKTRVVEGIVNVLPGVTQG
jgi:predicted deacetylase